MEYKINQKSINQNISKPSLNISYLSKINKKEEMNSIISNIKPNSHIDNNSINQINPSTPVSSFQMYPYEAESSPTNYIKSNSNINANNLTFLTNNNNNNSKKHNSKNYIKFIKITKDPSEGYSIHSDLNQSDFTLTNISNNKGMYGNNTNINLNSIKEEEKRITEKLEKNHKLRKKNKISNIETDEINNVTQNTIEEKDEEYEIIEKINSILKSDKKIKNNKNSDYIQQSLDTIFQESELLNETKKILDKKNSNKFLKFVNNKNGSEKKKLNEEEKQLEIDLKVEENKEEKEIMERIEKLRKAKEKKEEIDLEEKKLRKKLEEEKRKKRIEEERIKNLKIEEEEKMKKILEKEDEKIKMVKKEGELKKKELEKIKEELKKEEQQRKSLEKKADLLEIKIRNKKICEKLKTDNLINDSIGNDFKSTYSHTNTNTKLYFDYSSIPNSVENINKGDLNNKNNTDVNRAYTYNKINSAKCNKKFTSDRFNSSCYNYSYGTNPNIDKEMYNSHLITRNDDNSIIEKNYKNNNEEKKYESPKKKEKRISNNNSFCRSNSLTQFRMEIISENTSNKKIKKYNKNFSFTSFNFKINSKRNNFQNNINKYFNEFDENSEEINNVNSDGNDNLIYRILKEKNNKTSTKDVSTQYQEYYYNNKENINDNNNLFFRTQKNSIGNNIDKPEFRRSFSNYSKIPIPKKISHESNSNKDNNTSKFFDPKNNNLFEYNQFKSNYEKLKSCKKLNSTNFYIDNLFRINSLKKKSNNNEDEFYQKKSYVNLLDNKRNTYDKIPHHLKTDKNEGGLWSDFSLSGNKTRGLTDQSSSLYSNNGSYMSNKNKFNKKINTSVLPANPFDSVNEAREYFFFHD